MDDVDLDEFDAPGKSDFRRIGRGVPYVVDPAGKRTRYSRSSNSGKILDDESNLVDWAKRCIAYGAAQRPDLMAMASTLDFQRDKKSLRDIAEQCLVAGKGQERAIKGTAIHAMFDHLDTPGSDWEPAPQYVDVCNAYIDCLDRYGLVPVDIEVKCVNDDHRLAGTLDRRYLTRRTLLAPDGTMIPIGSYIVGDTKTGSTLEYASGSYSTQLAAYVDAVRYDVATDERIPFDPPNFPDWAVIIHADAELGTCEAYWIDVKAGREGLALARHVKAWRKRTDLIVPATPPLLTLPVDQAHADGHPVAQDGPDVPAVAPVVPQDGPGDVVAPVVAPDPVDGPGDPMVHDWLRERVKAILAHSQRAGKALQLAWPMNVPGLKQQGHTAAQLDAIEKACDRVETDYSVPFGPSKPSVELSKRLHPSWSDKWAKPSRDEPTPPDQVETQRQHINNHPRRQLIDKWVTTAVAGGISQSDTYPLSNALFEFASMDEADWPDDELTLMLEGSLRALGYDGIAAMGHFEPEHAPLLMSAAFAITAGNAMLLFDDHERPVVRVIKT